MFLLKKKRWRMKKVFGNLYFFPYTITITRHRTCPALLFAITLASRFLPRDCRAAVRDCSAPRFGCICATTRDSVSPTAFTITFPGLYWDEWSGMGKSVKRECFLKEREQFGVCKMKGANTGMNEAF